jgi:predicted ATPase
MTGEKIVLYGPNGAGKSAVIVSLISTIKPHYRSVDIPTIAIDKTGLNIQLPDGRGDLVVWHIDAVKARQIGAVRGCGTVFGGEEAYFAGELGLFAVHCPEVARRLYLEVYYDMARDPDLGWIPIRHLSYGQRRRLAIEAALATGDFVAIENFEAGLHVDAIVSLVKQMAESDAAVALETHSGLVLRLAMRYGFNMYYVEPAKQSVKLKRIERLDDTELFQRELSAYQAVV